MKKRIVLLLTVLALLVAMAVPVFAGEEGDLPETKTQELRLSDDLQTVYMEGKEYHRFDASDLQIYGREVINTANMTLPEQVREVALWDNGSDILRAEITYTDGAVLSVYYISDEGMKDVDALRAKTAYTVQMFTYRDVVQTQMEISDLKGERQVLYERDFQSAVFADVFVEHKDLSVEKGRVCQIDDKYYYVDYEENQINYISAYGAPSTVIVWEIQDQAACEKLDDIFETYYDSDVGILENSSFGKTVSAIMLIFVFMVVPLALVVFMLIVALRAKKKLYRGLAIVTGSCGLATLLSAVAFMILILVK